MAKGAITVKIDGQYDDKDINRAIKDLQALKSQADGGKGPMDGLAGGMKSLGIAAAGLFSIKAVGDFLTESAKAAIEDEKSLRMLNVTLSNLGFGAATADVAAFVDQTQATYGFLDDDLRPALARLVRSTGDVGKAEKALQTAMDISVGTGKDLQTVAAALGKAYDGNAASLGRLGLGLDQATLKSADMSKIMPKLNQMFGGQAAAAAETYEGKLKRVSIAADEAKETIGYALLGALDKASQAFGGTAGATGAITAMGNSLADFITGASTAVIEIGKLTAEITKQDDATVTHAVGVAALAAAYLPMVPVLGSLYAAYSGISSAGDAVATAEEHQARVVAAVADRYTGLANSIRPTTQQILENNAASEEAAVKLDAAAAAAHRVELATIHATDALKSWQQAISQSGSMDKWKSDLLKLQEEFKNLNTSLSDNSAAGLKNRDAIRGYASDLISAVEDWGNRYDKTVTQRIERQATEAKKLRTALINQGFKASDVDAFLGGLGLWNTQMRLIAQGMTRGQAASAMRYAGLAMGRQVGQGMVAGVGEYADKVGTAVTVMATSAINKGNQILEINSPSKVFQRMGSSIGEGLTKGIDTEKPKVSEAAKQLAQATIDKAQEIVDGWDEKLGKLKDVFDTKRAEMMDAAKGVSDAISSGLSFSSLGPKMDENGKLVGDSFLAGLEKQASNVVDFANKIQTLISMHLSQAAIQQVLSAGMEAGTAIADEIIAGGTTAIDQTNWFVESASAAADRVGLLAGVSWYGAGVTQAQKTYEGFRENFGEGGPARKAMENLMDRLAGDLSRTVTVSVQTVYQAAGIAGKRAMGGPVSANNAYLVGEKGPEVFVPNNAGNVISNSTLASSGIGGGGGPIINIYAGAGTDGYELGRIVVDSIKKYERVSGPVFAAA